MYSYPCEVQWVLKISIIPIPNKIGIVSDIPRTIDIGIPMTMHMIPANTNMSCGGGPPNDIS